MLKLKKKTEHGFQVTLHVVKQVTSYQTLLNGGMLYTKIKRLSLKSTKNYRRAKIHVATNIA